jgi:hypothetical protein
MTIEPHDKALFASAAAILRDNDRGAYTVPTKGLYPFQWNWDSCLTALGQRHFDEARAWTEIATLLAHQWPDGMVPPSSCEVAGYFGPDAWGPTGRRRPPASPSHRYWVRLERLYSEARQALPRWRARPEGRRIAGSASRDPAGTGLVAILHPWEAGRDNSIDWDEPFARVPTAGVQPYRRRDTQHVNAAERPTQEQYDRYMWLVTRFRELGWDNSKLHDASPFQVIDPGFNAILIRSDEALARLTAAIGLADIAQAARARIATARKAFDALWSDAAGLFLCFDRVAGKLIDSRSAGGLLPVFAGLGDTDRLIATMRRWREHTAFGVASHDPTDPRFEPRRYWRGPAWLIVNYLLTDGLRQSGKEKAAAAIAADSLGLIHKSGFAEYYDPTDGTACGGRHFTWTAAMVIELISHATAD